MSKNQSRSTSAIVAATIAALLTTFSAGAAHAQADAGSTKGLFLGIQYAGASVSVKDAAEDLKFGSGFGLHAGMGFSDNVALLVNFDRSAVTRRSDDNGLTLKQYDALLRVYLLPDASSPFRVFATAGATGRAVDKSTKFENIAPTAGAGLHVGITPHFAVTGTALWTFGNLTRLDEITGGSTTKEDFKSTGTRVQVGASLYLFR